MNESEQTTTEKENIETPPVETKPKKAEPYKVELPIPDLTVGEARTLLQVEKGADIWSHEMAMHFRQMQNRIPGYTRFFEIVRSHARPDDAGKVPFFAVQVTPEGTKLAKKFIEDKKLTQLSSVTP